jgi:hypothetical protein
MSQQMRTECRMCLHYYVTWDERRPHGCRAMKFKSKMVPSVVVMRSSGAECLLFELKKKGLPKKNTE